MSWLRYVSHVPSVDIHRVAIALRRSSYLDFWFLTFVSSTCAANSETIVHLQQEKYELFVL